MTLVGLAPGQPHLSTRFYPLYWTPSRKVRENEVSMGKGLCQNSGFAPQIGGKFINAVTLGPSFTPDV